MSRLAGLISERVLARVAREESVSPAMLRQGLAQGTIVIPMNRGHRCRPKGIGKGLSTKVNANIGTSPDRASLKLELAKLKAACDAGADTVMDLSTGGNIPAIRKAIIAESPVPVGTVPLYEASYWARRRGKSFVELTPGELLAVIEEHCRDGVDFITVHCGIRQPALRRLKRKPRLTGVVSRGGSMILEWMNRNGKENPLYQYYDELLAIVREYRVCLSLGDGLRPGSIADATDEAQVSELVVIGELVERARAAGVMAMVEGPGHVPLNQIQANVTLEKVICHDAPFYVLGPLVTDIGCGHDHITSAIGGALASYYGADFLCYVTPSEHLGLPDVADVRAGVIASRLAAHAGDVARGDARAIARDRALSQARARLDWRRMLALSLDPQRARKVFRARASATSDVCTMCGEFCAMKKFREVVKPGSSKSGRRSATARNQKEE
jgi:phosphomethylpyrimidine synthase